jgi:hypothetical protein
MTDISTLWTTLDPSIQQWFSQNPGTMVLPRTYVNMIEIATDRTLPLDNHGEYWLTPDDMQFLKAVRKRAKSSSWQHLRRRVQDPSR